MKNALSLFELIIVVVVISIILAVAVTKYSDSMNYSNKAKIKSQIAMIKNSIEKIKTKNILQDISGNIVLDDASINQENSSLFDKILQFPFPSTTTQKKELGKWIKSSSNTYTVYFNSDEYLSFKYENNLFKCTSDINICKEFE